MFPSVSEKIGPRLTGVLSRAGMGVAVYDARLECIYVNPALSRMNCIPSRRLRLRREPSGRLGNYTDQLEAALQFVRTTRKPLFLFELNSFRPEKQHLTANFCPLEHRIREVFLIVAFFFEAGSHEPLRSRLCRYAANTHARMSQLGCSSGAELSGFYARSAEMVESSIELLEWSRSVRRELSQKRVLEHIAKSMGVPELPQQAHSGWEAAQELAVNTRVAQLPGQSVPETTNPSRRERQVVAMVAEGKCNKEIAQALGLSSRTIEAYRARLMSKLHVHSVAELVRYAIRNNLILA
jgi:DNA-binding CsgD family transcriptional regulator